eukprot:3082887-Prymnesium_polylepis.1
MEYFEVFSPPIRSRYSEVVWKVLEPVPLPAAVVSKYNNSVMAVTGWEVDVVRLNGSKQESVPVYQSYNHHYTAQIRGAASRLPAWAVGAENIRHDLPIELSAAAYAAGADAVPTAQAFQRAQRQRGATDVPRPSVWLRAAN